MKRTAAVKIPRPAPAPRPVIPARARSSLPRSSRRP